MAKRFDDIRLFNVTLVLVLLHAIVSLLFARPASARGMLIAIVVRAAYSVFFWRRREWARFTVILMAVFSLLKFFLLDLWKHQIVLLWGDVILVPLAVAVLLLVFLRSIKEQFELRPLFV